MIFKINNHLVSILFFTLFVIYNYKQLGTMEVLWVRGEVRRVWTLLLDSGLRAGKNFSSGVKFC